MKLTTKLTFENETKKDRIPVVVRLRTAYYYKSGSYCKTKSLTFLKRKSDPEKLNCLDDEVSCSGIDLFIDSIVNLDSCPDGLYEIHYINLNRDWETGYIDDWEYKLIPYDDTETIQVEKVPDTTG